MEEVLKGGRVCSEPEKNLCPLPRCRARDTSWGDRELDIGVWSEAPHWPVGSYLFISLETNALLQRRLQDARTMKPFVEMFRIADGSQGPPGQEPAVCGGAFPIAGPSGEDCSEKQKTQRPHP